MNLKEYLIQSCIEEEKTLYKLLVIDNMVQYTNTIVLDVIKVISSWNNKEISLMEKYILITDGILENVIPSLLTYSNSISAVYVNKRYLGLYTWLIQRINDYYQNSAIVLDREREYDIYLERKQPILICGDEEFTEYMGDYFKNQKVIVLNEK